MRRNWRDERDSAALYEALARIEPNPRLSRVYGKLASSEQAHCRFWEEQLRARGQPLPPFRVSLRTRAMTALARRFGVGFVIPTITARELADRDRYSDQQDAGAAGLNTQERGHAAVMRAIGAYGTAADTAEAGPEPAPGGALGNNLRASVLGANDGLASNFCLLMGVAAGGASAPTIVLTGMAGLVGGACSMALGEWLSVTNAREMARSQRDRELAYAQGSASWEHGELALIHEAKGLNEDAARRTADRIMARDPDALATLSREEQLMDAAHAGVNPASAAAYSFALFAIGALVPLLPFFALRGRAGTVGCVAVSLLALFALGLLTSFFNGRAPLYSGARQVVVGAIAAAVTFAVGHVVGTLL
jgi:VIT1/CCC1 family predicted Fe2+/Mn2+ transporter